ncbi:hypothetical protein ES707_18151 [subsurface metagenome]
MKDEQEAEGNKVKGRRKRHSRYVETGFKPAYLKYLSEPQITMMTLIFMMKDKRYPVFHLGNHLITVISGSDIFTI